MVVLVLELVHRNLPAHMDDCLQSHLLLTLGRITEHHGALIAVSSKVAELDQTTSSHTSTLSALNASVAAQAVAMEAVERRVMKALGDEVSSLDKKTTKALTGLHNEIGTLRNGVQQQAQAQATAMKALKK